MESKIIYHETVERYIIKQLWISPLENKVKDAVGYNIVGFTENPEDAEDICNAGNTYDVNDCWAIQGKMPEFIYESVKLILDIE
jgi:hypothetical protein